MVIALRLSKTVWSWWFFLLVIFPSSFLLHSYSMRTYADELPMNCQWFFSQFKRFIGSCPHYTNGSEHHPGELRKRS